MADGMGDYFKALDMLKNSTKQLGTMLAVNATQRKMAEAQQHAQTDQEKFQVNQEMGKDLAMRLTSIGSSPEQIQAATGNLIPSASSLAQIQGQERMQGKELAAHHEEGDLERKNKIQIEQMKLDAITGKTNQKGVTDAMSKFEKMPEITLQLKSLPVLQDAVNKMNENMGQYGATAVTNLVKMGIVKAAVTRVTDKELQAANESPSAAAAFKKEYGLQTTGELPTNVQEFWKKIASDQLANTKKSLSSGISAYSQSVPGVDPSTLKRNLQLRHNIQNPNQAQIDQIKAYMMKPEIQADTARMEQAHKKLKDLGD